MDVGKIAFTTLEQFSNECALTPQPPLQLERGSKTHNLLKRMAEAPLPPLQLERREGVGEGGEGARN
jgi:hypothetical protein